ncbi:MAG: alpha/beta hydrolase, partial [Ketobacteraceae bacterium]|nr:alpha/beta hydrolase [Ketobacteraceae bacterium]
AGSFDVSSRSLNIDGEDYYYLEAGSQHIETIVFLHGFGLSRNHWRGLIHLTCGRFRVIALEVPGLSQTVQLGSASYSLKNLADWLSRFLVARDLRECHLIGFSAGACIAAYQAAACPDRLKSLGLIGFPDLEYQARNLFNNSFDPCHIQNVNNLEDVIALWNRQFFDPPKLPKIMSRMYLHAFKSQKPFYTRVFSDISQSAPLLMARLHRIQTPTLLLRGSKDSFCSINTLSVLKSIIPQAKLREIQNAGHLVYLEKQVAVSEHITRFIENIPQKNRDMVRIA